MFGFRQRSLYSRGRRLRNFLVRRFSNRVHRTQRVDRVTINGHDFKRLVVCDSHLAALHASNLRAFSGTGLYPSLVHVKENELWVEYIEGSRIERVDAALVEQMAGFFAGLYDRRPRRLPTGQTSFAHDALTDLRFLEQAGVLAAGPRAGLEEQLEKWTPPEVWIGYDCSDAILKNFVRSTDGRIRCIDVDSLVADRLLGTGVAKARLRWLGEHGDLLVERLRQSPAPDFHAYLPFIELCFSAAWQKACFLEGKKRFVDAAVLERFLH